jgi:hypothetical protein
MAIFGDNIVAVRLPSVVEFYITGLMLFFYTRRKLGYAYAAIPFLIFCYCPYFFRYSTEVRPYALLCMFFSVLLLCWDVASTEHYRWALWGVAIANLGMLGSHVFAVVSLSAFLMAEFVRFLRTRKPDYALWAALVLPMIVMIGYLPLFPNYGAAVFPAAFQSSPKKVAVFFWHVLFDVTPGVIVAAVIAWLVARRKLAAEEGKRFRLADYFLFGVLLLNPVSLSIVMMHRAWWDRYCLTSVLAIYLVIAAFLAWWLRFDKRAGWTVTIVLSCLILVQRMAVPLVQEAHSAPTVYAAALAHTRPDLPIVPTSGVTYLEMDHYESPAIVSRLHYLLGGPAAVKYAHATIFEGFGRLKEDFPIRSKVEPYSDFIRAHHEFLVFGSDWWPEDWLLKKLAADGAKITIIHDYARAPFVGTTLYHVAIAGNETGKENGHG